MFFLIAVFVAALVISLVLSPKPKITNATSGKLNDFSFPRASYGSPVPRWYGTCKFKAPNTIWDGDFKAVPITKKVKTGLFSSKKQTVGYKYYIGFDLAVCLGPNFEFRRIWAGQYELWNGCVRGNGNLTVVNVNLPDLFGGQDKNGGFSGSIALYSGAFDQARDPYLASKVDPNVPAYVGVAHMVFRQCYIGQGTSLQPIYVEGSHFSNSLEIPGGRNIMPGCLDINPVEMLYDLHVNDWGNLEVDAALIDVEQWREVGIKIYNERNGMSVVVANRATGGDVAKEILAQINATMYEDPATGLFQLVLLRNDYEIDDLPVLGPGEILRVSNFTKMLWSETFNRIRVKYTDRANGFKEDSVAIAEDFANIRYQGTTRTTDVTFEGVYEADLATELAARELSNMNVPLYSFELEIDRLAANLRPGSPFIWHWPEYGIESMVCRIRKFGLGTLQDGKLTASVVQDQFAVNATVIASPAGSTYQPPDYSAKAIVKYHVFEVPYFLDKLSQLGTPDGEARLGVFAFKPGSYSTTFSAYIVGNDGDAEVLQSAPYSDSAKLVAALPKFEGFVDALLPTLEIHELNQGGDGFPLRNRTEADVRQGANLFELNGELMAYETFVDNGDGTYTLNNVHRALLDTTFEGGAIDDVAYFFDGQEGFFGDATPIGEATTLYLQDIAAGGRYPVADAERIDATPQGRATFPLPADDLTLDGDRAADSAYQAGTSPVLAWAARDRLAGAVALEGDAGQADEAGVTYALDVADSAGNVVATVDPIASGDAVPMPAAAAGSAVLRLWSKRDGVASYQPAEYPVTVYLAGNALFDGEPLLIDGKGVEFDA